MEDVNVKVDIDFEGEPDNQIDELLILLMATAPFNDKYNQIINALKESKKVTFDMTIADMIVVARNLNELCIRKE